MLEATEFFISSELVYVLACECFSFGLVYVLELVEVFCSELVYVLDSSECSNFELVSLGG